KDVMKFYSFLIKEKLPISKLFTQYTIHKATFYRWKAKYSNSEFINTKDNIAHVRETSYKPNNVKVTPEIKKEILKMVDDDPQIISSKINEKINEKFKIEI